MLHSLFPFNFFWAGHSIFNKWALIIDPKDPWAGPCGFVKVDMSVVERGQEVKASHTTTHPCTEYFQYHRHLFVLISIFMQHL